MDFSSFLHAALQQKFKHLFLLTFLLIFCLSLWERRFLTSFFAKCSSTSINNIKMNNFWVLYVVYTFNRLSVTSSGHIVLYRTFFQGILKIDFFFQIFHVAEMRENAKPVISCYFFFTLTSGWLWAPTVSSTRPKGSIWSETHYFSSHNSVSFCITGYDRLIEVHNILQSNHFNIMSR